MNRIEIVCTGRDTHELWRVGFVVEVNLRSPVRVGCAVLRDAAGQRTGVQLDLY